ncbi:MAG TPA: hypothetical protein VKR42_00535, partial [Ktedonobacteraceae bacterium]|nr:hypothetical protein [Ktedonobacteraceae bacterium]
EILCEAYRAALLVKYIALNFATICCKITPTHDESSQPENGAAYDHRGHRVLALMGLIEKKQITCNCEVPVWLPCLIAGDLFFIETLGLVA